MGKKENLAILMRMQNNFLVRSISYLIPSISLDYGLDVAVMFAILVQEYMTTRQVHSLLEIDGRLYAKSNIDDILNFTNIWSKDRAIEIIEDLISNDLITASGYEKNGILIYYVI